MGESMGFKLALAQCAYPSDGDVVAQVRDTAAAAARKGADMLVFPEFMMCPPKIHREELIERAQNTDGPFASSVCGIAAEFGLWIVFVMLETSGEGLPPYNTALVAGSDGKLHGSYRKCHLYDAHEIRESDRMSAGGELSRPIHAPFATFALSICYDLRFPEAVRGIARECDLLIYPAAWMAGPRKDEQWETLIRARAIENECFVAGACRAGEPYVERSMVADPLGTILAQAKEGEALLVVDIDPGEVASARDAMPVFDHLRKDLY